jgi:hypothetical protein
MFQRYCDRGQNAWRMRMLLMFSAFWVGLGINAHAKSRFGFCLVKRFSGIDCPACGLTRSITRLCAGDLSGAIRQHPLGLLFAVLTAGFFLYFATALVCDQKQSIAWRVEVRVFKTISALAFGALALAWLLKLK